MMLSFGSWGPATIQGGTDNFWCAVLPFMCPGRVMLRIALIGRPARPGPPRRRLDHHPDHRTHRPRPIAIPGVNACLPLIALFLPGGCTFVHYAGEGPGWVAADEADWALRKLCSASPIRHGSRSASRAAATAR